MTKETKTSDLKTPELTQADAVAPEPTVADTDPASSYASAPSRLASFDEFYPVYIAERTQPNNRRLHVIGTGLALLCLTQVIMWGVIGGFWSLVWAAILGFGLAAAGDHFVEKIKPSATTYPAWTLMADFKMFWEVVTRKRAW